MDVSLILTHRCNLACGYCYAGEHHKTDIDEEVLRRAVDLLYSDGAPVAQLSFFGGEPFLAFDAMKRATALAEARAAELGTTLLLQCTSNGSVIDDEHVRFALEHDLRVTISIDGVREAHDRNRPCAGGKPSFDQVYGGMRRLLDAGAGCDAMMVITPQTSPYAYLSANFLWSAGVRTLRANLALDQQWTDADRGELREQLVSIGWELLARRLRGEEVAFDPFDKGMEAFHARAELAPKSKGERQKLVVATSGNLYPCAPMVGEDRDSGPEAGLRLGHLDDGPTAISAAVATEGVACESGKGCQCAAYLETGNRYTPGQIGRWYGLVCREIGGTLAESITRHELRPRIKPQRRGVLIGLAAIVGGAAVGAPLLAGLLSEDAPRPCQLGNRKAVAPYNRDLDVAGGMASPDPEPTILGEMAAPDPEPEPEPEPEVHVRGGMGRPLPPPPPDGDMF